MPRKQFTNEAEIYDMSDDKLDTNIGYFDLDYRPYETSYDQTRVIRIGDHAIVAYLTIEEGCRNPLEEMDGWGTVIRKENNKHEWRLALDLTSDDDVDYEGIRDDEVELEAIRRSFKQLYTDHWEGEVVKVEKVTDTPDDDASWTVTTACDGVAHVYRGSTFRIVDEWRSDIFVCVLGKAMKIMDDEAILKEFWLKARTAGDVGEKWGVLLRKNGSDDLYVDNHWSKIDLDEHWRSDGVWYPDADLVPDIEGRPEAEQMERCLGLAREAVGIYNEWANGNCYDVNVEIHKQKSDSGKEFDPDEDEWEQVLDVHAMQDKDCAGGIYYGSDEAEEMMDEFIAQAIDEVYKLQGVTGKNEEGIILGQQ